MVCKDMVYKMGLLKIILQLKNQPAEENPTVKVKISGDGARMSHSSSLFVCSFSIFNLWLHKSIYTVKTTTKMNQHFKYSTEKPTSLPRIIVYF